MAKDKTKVKFVSWVKPAHRKRARAFSKSQYAKKLRQATERIKNDPNFKKALKKYNKEAHNAEEDQQFCNHWKISYTKFIFGEILAQPAFIIKTEYKEGKKYPSLVPNPNSSIPIHKIITRDRRAIDKIYSNYLEYYHPREETRGRKRRTYCKITLSEKKKLRKAHVHNRNQERYTFKESVKRICKDFSEIARKITHTTLIRTIQDSRLD